MAVLDPGGLVVELYREHIRSNPATYTGPVTDDFLTNAVSPQTPTNTGRGFSPAYATQQNARTWHEQLKTRKIQT